MNRFVMVIYVHDNGPEKFLIKKRGKYFFHFIFIYIYVYNLKKCWCVKA